MSSGFITEAEITEARKKRQEDWERVRKPDDPVVRPEEPYDSRSLYDRLQEQKQKKDLEYEEAHKLKNMIKGLDDDEIEFLDLVDRTKIAADRKKELEEEIELNDYRNRVASLQEKSLEERLQAEISVNKPKAASNRPSQQKLLKGIVVKKTEGQKRKSSTNGNDEEMKRSKLESEENKQEKLENTETKQETTGSEGSSKRKRESETDVKNEGNSSDKIEVEVASSGLKCVGILPGLGCYSESTSDENSSDSEVEQCSSKIDILGRKIIIKSKETS